MGRPTFTTFAIAIFLASIAPHLSFGQDPNHVVTPSSASGPPGSLVTLSVQYDNTSATGVAGWSYGICHEESGLNPVSWETGSSIATFQNGAPVDYEVMNVYDNAFDTGAAASGFAHFVVVSLFAGIPELPPGVGYELATLTYEVVGFPGTTEVRTCNSEVYNGPIAPPVPAIMAVQGVSVPVTLGSSDVTIEEIEPYILRPGFAEVDPSNPVTVPVDLIVDPSAQAVVAGSFGVCQDTEVASVVSAELGASLASIDLDFVSITTHTIATSPLGTAPGASLEFVLAATAPALSAGTHELLTIDYEAIGAIGSSTSLDPCSDVANDAGLPTAMSVSVGSGSSFAPFGDQGQLAVADLSQQFQRVDCNADGTPTIADPIFLLAYLFSDGDSPQCEKACDLDDSGTVDLGDAISYLNLLFLTPLEIEVPEPSITCGVDTTPDSLTCEAFDICP